MTRTQDLIHRLRTRAQIRRQIATRKSVQEGKPDKLADLLDEAAGELEKTQRLVEAARAVVNCGDQEYVYKEVWDRLKAAEEEWE